MAEVTKPKFLIEELYLFIREDEEGEGLMFVEVPVAGGSKAIPLIAGDADRVNSYMELAASAAKEGGFTFKVLQFATRTDVTEQFSQPGKGNEQP